MSAELNANQEVRVYSEAQQLATAQNVLDTHVTSSATGRCLACGVLGPCFRRETAMAVYSVKRWLPRRIPGLSQPERIGARRVDLAKAALRVGRMRLRGGPHA
ncbi:hypothetical protein [Phytohabitans rumicis]|uniref:hypothetical protein n=1 Tax=Phytohabitans rumicis TaxID=1076125 RepID=UPI001FE6CB6C|nr:hypothetical protein [Phytohabitans rumicis]